MLEKEKFIIFSLSVHTVESFNITILKDWIFWVIKILFPEKLHLTYIIFYLLAVCNNLNALILITLLQLCSIFYFNIF